MTENQSPQLAPPGAGLPAPELFIARILFKIGSAFGNREEFLSTFDAEQKAITRLSAPLSAGDASRRVLIKRQRGMEDSSRYWSVWMTLDHLRIVNGQIARIIRSLASGQTPSGRASTANVKPSPEVDYSVVEAFVTTCAECRLAIEEAPELRTAARYEHPWFGPMDAHSWAGLSGRHMQIHRLQIEAILSGLNKGSTPADGNEAIETAGSSRNRTA